MTRLDMRVGVQVGLEIEQNPLLTGGGPLRSTEVEEGRGQAIRGRSPGDEDEERRSKRPGM